MLKCASETTGRPLPNTSKSRHHRARTFGGVSLTLEVLPSMTGYYLDTRDHNGMPYSRESEEYWKTRKEAQAALDDPSPHAWTQRLTP
jgi:hypothetical protein